MQIPDGSEKDRDRAWYYDGGAEEGRDGRSLKYSFRPGKKRVARQLDNRAALNHPRKNDKPF